MLLWHINKIVNTHIYEIDWLIQYANFTNISANIVDSSTDINTSIINIGGFYRCANVKNMADTDTDINIGASLTETIRYSKGVYMAIICGTKLLRFW